ncbi:DUF481 domain-containing protein [Limibacter armeniacum]|uniref:DUF481 domain-containing protein n=1 Tax=Limibacter armeniacum TaxID=466084 RepID=UPI002FE666D4
MKTLFTLIFMAFICFPLLAQKDTLKISDEEKLIGEIKGMDRGIITMSTDYSKDDFKIKWEDVQQVKTHSHFLISLSDGRRVNGNLTGVRGENIHLLSGEADIEIPFDDVVYLKQIKEDFWSKVYTSIDLGYNHTKANNLQQFSIGGTLGYLTERWWIDMKYNDIRSSQDDAADVHRTDANIGFRYFLPREWFLLVDLSFLSNTEQNLDLRTLLKSGLGNYLVQTNHTYWGVTAGLAFNNENFMGETPDKQSLEAFASTELNFFDVGDWSLLTNVSVYRSITEDNRWRTDFSLDTNYDLPLNFYIRLGGSLNYDSQPAEDGSKSDYVIRTHFGWKL